MLKNKIILLILSLSLFQSCKWRVEDQPGYWVITFPQDGATCNEKVTLSIDANDPDGICGVEVNVNDLKIDIPLSEILGNLNKEPIEVSLNTNELPDGPISVSVSICDCNDNCTESPSLDYTVDNTLSVPDTSEKAPLHWIKSALKLYELKLGTFPEVIPTTPDSSVALKVTVTSFDSDETSTELGVNVRSDNKFFMC